MNILITGSAGFIGFHLAQKLLKKKINVIGIDNLNNYYDVSLKKNRLNILKKYKNYNHIKLDLSKTNELFTKTTKIKFNIIVHLAAQAGVRYSIDNPLAYATSNLVGFTNILELARIKKVNKLIYASSSSVYGSNNKAPFKEKANTDLAESFYAATKKSNEVMANSYSKLYDLNTIGLRFFTVYGPWGRPDMALFKFTKSILEGKTIKLFNKGNHFRDFTFIDDIVEGIYSVIINKSRFNNLIINLGRGKKVSLLKFLNTIEQKLCKKSKIVNLSMQKGDVYQTSASIYLAKKLFGYKPKVNIDNGVSQFVDWYKDYFRIKK